MIFPFLYEFILYQETKNIPSNTILSYSLFDGEEDISNYLSVENNYVAENNINVTISIDNSINPGKYILKTSYGSYSVDSYITINSNLLLDGDGTSKNPFIIKSENEIHNYCGFEKERFDFYILYTIGLTILIASMSVYIIHYKRNKRINPISSLNQNKALK